MTVTMTRVPRSGPAVHATLAESSEAEAAQFEEEYRSALTRAADTLDLGEADAVLTRWWGIATIRANPLTAAEEDLVEAVRAGHDLPADAPVVADPRPAGA